MNFQRSITPIADISSFTILVGNVDEKMDETIDLEEEPVYEVEISEEDLNEVAKEATAHITTKGGSTPDGVSSLEEPAKENGVIKNAATKDIHENAQNKAENKTKEKELHESLVVMRKKYQEAVAENNKKTKSWNATKKSIVI